MRKKILLFNLIVIILIALNSNIVYSDPIDNIENEQYKKLEDLKKELREERREIDQQRLEEIRKKEEEKKQKMDETNLDDSNKNNNEENEVNEKKVDKEKELIPSLIVRLRGKHSTKYLCSYHFIIENDNAEIELSKNNIGDYKVLLKKPSLKVRAGEVINFEFSEKPKKVRAYIWGDEIIELEMKRGSIKVPSLDKKIVIGVEGTYKNGQILYAIVLDIRA